MYKVYTQNIPDLFMPLKELETHFLIGKYPIPPLFSEQINSDICPEKGRVIHTWDKGL